ncbi:MAG: leucine-rich repeat protein [Prevotella sp.]|nr:leucine-rich repeat protein [Prevotella sp.]
MKNVYSCLIQSVKSINLENVDTIGSLGSKTYYTSYFYPKIFNNSETARGFRECSQLESVDLSNVKFIGKQAFLRCTGLKEVTIHHNMAPFEAAEGYNNFEVNAIEQFQECTGLEKVTFTGNASIIPYKCFYHCNNIETVDFGSIETICAYAFSSDSKLKVADLSNVSRLAGYEYSSGRYDGYHFQGCTNLDTVKLGQQLNTIPYYSFSNCTSLRSINLENVVSYWSGALSDCSSLVIENLDWTGKNMEFGTTPFTKVTLKFVHLNSETVLGRTPDVSASANRRIFNNLKNSNIYIEDTNPANWSKADLIGPIPTSASVYSADGWHSYYTSGGENTDYTGSNVPTNYLYVPASALQAWRTAEGWSEIADRILPYPPRYVLVDNKQVTDGVVYEEDATNQTLTLTSIGNNTGAKLEIPGSFPDGYTVKGIGKTGETGICQGNTDFTQVVLPNSLTTIGDDAFNGCTNLAAINLDSVKVYGDNALKGCSSLNVHLDLRHATAIGQEAFANCALKSAWIGQATGLGMFSNPATPLNVYVFEEDPSKVSGTNVTTGLDTKSVVYVVCRNITSSEINKNPLDAFHQNAEWGDDDAWKFVYPMLHKGNAIEREKTYTTFCFDKPLDFRGTNAEGTNYNVDGSDSWQLYYNDPMTYPEKLADRYANDDLELRGMLQFYLQPENNTSGFIDNRIEALAVTGFQYNQGGTGTVESGTIVTKPVGIRPAGTGVLVHWHPDTEFHGGTGLTEYYPIPPVRDASGNRMTEEAFREFFTSCTDKIRTGTYENNTGLVNSGGRNLDRLEEGDEDGQYKDNYEGGTTTYNTTTGTYTGSGYDNLMIGNTVRKDSIFYNPWYYAYATTGETGEYVWENNKHVIDYNNKEFDSNYKQFGLNTSCYFQRFHKKDEYDRPTGSYMRAYRAFLRMPLKIDGEEDGSSNAPMINALFTISSSLDDETTGIDHVTKTGNVRSENNVIYSLDGKKVSNNGLNSLPKGIYIINGRKVVKK